MADGDLKSHDKLLASPGRGRAITMHDYPEPAEQSTARGESSMSRGRTRKPIDEYDGPPGDPAGYVTSPAETFIHPDGRGGFTPRRPLSPRTTPGRRRNITRNESGEPLPGEEYLRQRSRERHSDARTRAAAMERELRELHRLPGNPRDDQRPGSEARGYQASWSQRIAKLLRDYITQCCCVAQ